MARLKKDVKINDEAFDKAEEELKKLVGRAETLKNDLASLFEGLMTALQCETGDELELAEQEVVLKPIENLQLVLNQIHDTLELVKGEGYYKNIFSDFEELQKGFTGNP